VLSIFQLCHISHLSAWLIHIHDEGFKITTNVVAGPCNHKFCWRNINGVGHSTVCWCEEGTSWIQFPNLRRALNCNMFCPFFACSTTDTLNGGKRLASIFQELVVCFRHQNVCYTTFQVCIAHPWRLQGYMMGAQPLVAWSTIIHECYPYLLKAKTSWAAWSSQLCASSTWSQLISGIPCSNPALNQTWDGWRAVCWTGHPK